MRRPRSRLQVSTFPFLAVLLCAMGALLLLLFIMDRRAKIAGQHTAAEAVAERKKRTQAEEEARQAEWQKAKDLLHQSLLEQHGAVLGEVQTIADQTGDVANQSARAQTQQTDLKKKVQEESAKLALLRLEIASQRTDLKNSQATETRSRKELLEAAQELAELERAFQLLKALKEREKNVHSVVPYRGKHGDDRKPIYVECIDRGVTFHPEKKTLDRYDFTPDAFKDEIERRTGTLAVQKPKDKNRPARDEAKGPYVLFLVRPAGITTYYKTQAALRGYQIDFGYELVDEDWVLDFNVDPNAKPAPVAVAGNVPARKPDPPLLPMHEERGFTPGPSIAGSPSGVVAAPSMGTPGFPPFSVNMEPNTGKGRLPSAAVRTPTNPGTGGSAGNLERGPGPVGVPILPPPPSTPDPGSRSSAFVPIGKVAPPVPIASSPGAPGLAPPSIPAPGSRAGPKLLPDEAPASETSKKTLPAFGADDSKKPPPAMKLVGNRDFIITIDCYADHATVFPSGLQFRWTVANAAAVDQALTKAVVNLIERRQATVREGEPLYRPVIRFQVSPEGRRTYFRVYPLLEQLGVAMTRENVVD